jgi:hypothetical protein
MNANLGGFASVLIKDPVWVMNVVPVQANVNTLGAIYERGLIGIYHDWLAQLIFHCVLFDQFICLLLPLVSLIIIFL